MDSLKYYKEQTAYRQFKTGAIVRFVDGGSGCELCRMVSFVSLGELMVVVLFWRIHK